MQLVKINKVFNTSAVIKKRYMRRFSYKQKRAFCLCNCYITPPILLQYMWYNEWKTDLQFIGAIILTVFFSLPFYYLFFVCK